MKHNPKSPFEKTPNECPRKCAECAFFKPGADRMEGTCTANGARRLTYDFSRPTDRPLPMPLNSGYRKQSEGEWVVDGDERNRRAECSSCHHEYAVQKGMLQLHRFSYCPNCGAKMKGGTDEKSD